MVDRAPIYKSLGTVTTGQAYPEQDGSGFSKHDLIHSFWFPLAVCLPHQTHCRHCRTEEQGSVTAWSSCYNHCSTWQRSCILLGKFVFAVKHHWLKLLTNTLHRLARETFPLYWIRFSTQNHSWKSIITVDCNYQTIPRVLLDGIGYKLPFIISTSWRTWPICSWYNEVRRSIFLRNVEATIDIVINITSLTENSLRDWVGL